jgi:hypothetical protein
LRFGVALRRMTEDETVKIRARWSRSGRPALRSDQTTELRELYSELQEVSAYGTEALGDIDSVTADRALALRRFLELQARASAIIERVREILS